MARLVTLLTFGTRVFLDIATLLTFDTRVIIDFDARSFGYQFYSIDSRVLFRVAMVLC